MATHEKQFMDITLFCKFFLTHSALERFIEIYSRNLDALEPLLIDYGSEQILQEIFKKDQQGLLFDFIYQRVNNKVKSKLMNCRHFQSANVAYISAGIRHIFAHGYLCAYSNRISPKNVYYICRLISDFLINFMDSEFTKTIVFFSKKIEENIS